MKSEAELWTLWIETKSSAAIEALIQHYLPLVQFHVQRVSKTLPISVTKDELQSHALEGLFDAIQKFDANRDLKFDTYASFRIRGAMIDGLRKEDRLPRTVREKIKRMDTVVEQLEQSQGRSVAPSEIAREMNVTEKEVSYLKFEQLNSTTLSFDDVLSTSNDVSYHVQVRDERMEQPGEALIHSDTKRELIERIKALNENEQLVIQLSYFEELSLTDIGKVLDLSTSRISQIHAKAIKKLKQGFAEKAFVR